MKKIIDYQKYCVIIPAYNPGKTILKLIQAIRAVDCYIQIIVVNDGSTDDTISSIPAKQSVLIHSHAMNMGKGAAIRSGVRYARDRGFRYGLFLDADMQHDPALIHEFIEKREVNHTDLVLGIRSFFNTGMPFHRILSNSITSFLISLRVGRRIHDSQCGYRLVDLTIPAFNQCHDQGFQFESEFLVKSIYTGASYCEVVVPTIYHQSGFSSISNLLDTFRFIRMFLISYGWF